MNASAVRALVCGLERDAIINRVRAARDELPDYTRFAEMMRRYRRDHYDDDEPTGP